MLPDLDGLYSQYARERTPDTLEALLNGVRAKVIDWYESRHRNDVDDIAQKVCIKIWRMLERGELKPFDPSRGKFSPYVTTMARTTAIDLYRYERLVVVGESALVKMIEGDDDLDDALDATA